MPTYQYACTECGEQLEAVQSFSDDALTECPACSGRLRKVFSAVGVVFKGSGFYRNDSRKVAGAAKDGGTDKAAAAEKTKDKPAEKVSSDKASAKPAAAASSSGASSAA